MQLPHGKLTVATTMKNMTGTTFGMAIASCRHTLFRIASRDVLPVTMPNLEPTRGNYARIIYSQMVEGASLYCFDTFTGFPEISVQKELGTTGHAVSVGTFSDTSQAKVEHAIAGRTSPPCLVLRAGEFPATFMGLEDRQWRFVLLDADLYAPIKAGLETFWPRLVPGGFILCHDCLSGYPGVRKAVDEFFDPLGIVPVPWPDRVGPAVVGKSWNAISNP